MPMGDPLVPPPGPVRVVRRARSTQQPAALRKLRYASNSEPESLSSAGTVVSWGACGGTPVARQRADEMTAECGAQGHCRVGNVRVRWEIGPDA